MMKSTTNNQLYKKFKIRNEINKMGWNKNKK